ncbi:hypothetical protein PLESTM_001249700 [Pleodorina starrii]|nr:hypothetical protein PLESTM_001249700 [Pleodorina starrii]
MGEGGSSNRPRWGANVSLQVDHLGSGAVIIDGIGKASQEHLGACVKHFRPLHHLPPTDPATEVLAGRPAAAVGDPCQHPQPGCRPAYHFLAQLERDLTLNPSAPNAAAPQQGESGTRAQTAPRMRRRMGMQKHSSHLLPPSRSSPQPHSGIHVRRWPCQ